MQAFGSSQEVAEVAPAVNMNQSLQVHLARQVDTSEDPVGSTLVDGIKWPADAILGTSSAVGFLVPFVWVARRMPRPKIQRTGKTNNVYLR